MLLKSFYFIPVVFLSLTCFSQKVLVNVFMQNKRSIAASDTIYYDTAKSLTWKDFKGTPDAHSMGGAITSSGFAFDADIRIEANIIYINIGVYTYFSKGGSWKKANINSAYHLLHEQHHFDITRLGAQDLIKQIAKAHFTKDNYSQLINTVFDKVYHDNMALQAKYDRETEHSINNEKQLEWNDKISAEIKMLK